MKKMMLKRAILNVRMLFVIAVNFILLFLSLFEYGIITVNDKTPSITYDILTMYTIPFAISSFIIFAGIFPGVPYAFSYLEERNSGYLKYIQIRINAEKYVKWKIFFSGLSGGVSIMIPGIMIFAVICLIGREVIPGENGHIFTQLMWEPYMYIWGGRFVLLLKAILLFLFGVMWAELALLFSNIFKNRYVAYVLPFLAYELMWLVFPVGIWNPVYLVRSDFGREVSVLIPYLVDIGYIAILCFMNMALMKRRGRR